MGALCSKDPPVKDAPRDEGDIDQVAASSKHQKPAERLFPSYTDDPEGAAKASVEPHDAAKNAQTVPTATETPNAVNEVSGTHISQAIDLCILPRSMRSQKSTIFAM